MVTLTIPRYDFDGKLKHATLIIAPDQIESLRTIISASESVEPGMPETVVRTKTEAEYIISGDILVVAGMLGIERR